MDPENERWRTLCEQAAKEQDLGRLVRLVREINRLLSSGCYKKNTSKHLL